MAKVKKETRGQRVRNPDGCTQAVMSHLTVAERQQLDQLAKQEMRTLSATIRMLVVQGMRQHQGSQLRSGGE